MLNSAFTEYLNTQLSNYFNEGINIVTSKPISGGCINSAHCLHTKKADYFLKYNDAKAYPKMFETEQKGVDLLHSTNTINVAKTYFTGNFDDNDFILIEFIEQGSRNAKFWEQFANQLAQLHLNTDDNFGLDYDNYIGSLKQCNTKTKDWIEFFINCRIEPQLNLAFDAGLANKSYIKKFNNLFNSLKNIFPEEQPALLHGDLWSGNFMTNSRGEPTIFDPAVYYGHREMELAFTNLFGGFEGEFYNYYHQFYPIEKGFEGRKDYYNLYPLLVHVNLFGKSYLQQIDSILRQF